MSKQLGSKKPFFSRLVYQYPSLRSALSIRYSIPVSILMASYLYINMQTFYSPNVDLSKLENSEIKTFPDYANNSVTFYS
jgi:hypothetical protein